MLVSASSAVLYFGSIPVSLGATEQANGKIAFASSRDGNFEIYTMDSDGTNEERITNNPSADVSPSWSPNGTKLAFIRDDSVHVMDADGTDIRKLTPSGLISSDPVWSPDGKKILFSAVTDGTDRDIYVIEAGAETPTDLTANNAADDFEPRWMADGEGILFTSGMNGTNFGIFRMDGDGKGRTTVFGNGSSMHPEYSPVTKRIVFSSNMEKSFDIYSMNHDGSNVTRLTGGTSNEGQPSWSPDGTKIVFTSNKGSKYEQVHIMNYDGSDPDRLTRNQHKDLSPEFQKLAAPVKEQLPILRENGLIAFASERNGTFAELYLMHPDGTNVTQIGSNVDSIDSHPRWSPSADKIAFVSKLDGREEIVVIAADGSNRTSLIQSTSPFAGLGWSPNGTHLVFAKGDANHRWIFVMNSEGGAVKRMTISEERDSDPTWSPDGTRIAFTRNIDGSNEIYVMNQDGTKQKRLTNNPASDHSPRWSPEAEQIVFVTDRDGNEEVYVMNADGKAVKNLTNNTAADAYPSWSPDGSRITFVSDRSQDGEDIYIMDSDGKNQDRVTMDRHHENQPDFGSSKVSTTQNIGRPVEEPEIYEFPLNSSGPLLNSQHALGNITTGQKVAIMITATSSDEDRVLRSEAIMQVRDEFGITRHIDSQKRPVNHTSGVEYSFTWTPEESGSYELVIFIIENSEDPSVLAQSVGATVAVRDAQSA